MSNKSLSVQNVFIGMASSEAVAINVYRSECIIDGFNVLREESSYSSMKHIHTSENP